MSEWNDYAVKMADKAKNCAHEVAQKSTKEKNAALKAITESVLASADTIVAANAKDIEFSTSIGKNQAFLDRLKLDRKRIESMVKAVEDIITLPDPVGSGNLIQKRPSGLKIQKIRVPIGVVLMIYESRPNVTSDAAALCLKSGNVVILRGGKESVHSNLAIASAIRAGLKKAGFPEDAVTMIDKTDYEIVDELLQLDKTIDLVIPRGGERLIRSVSEKSLIPVIKHDKGVCHVYVDANADKDMAEAITVNAKVSRPSVCNAAETLLVHKDYPYKKELVEALLAKNVEVRADETIRGIVSDLPAATEEDWFTEYLDFIISAKVVSGTDEAIEHINHYGSHHSDAIVSKDYGNIQKFLDGVDSAAVYANASTRFTDGGEFGLGAELGISTQKLHVRGPMGLEGLTTEKWIIYGEGQIR